MTQYRCSSFQAEVIVLKFGSSILESFDHFKDAAVEVKRFVDKGYKVIAVVSAIGNTTDTLENQSALDLSNNQTIAKARALLLSTGELQSVAYLTQTLLQHGIQSNFITRPIVAEGDYANATPLCINQSLFHALLNTQQAIVVPGFIAENKDNEPCLLGRGGSDLSALFIAHQLQAKRCILLKDVDGVYHLDPNKFKEAIRYETLTYDCAKEKATQVIQPQAITWAKAHCLTFQIGKLNGNNYTTVGTLETKQVAQTLSQAKIYEVA
ncbi:amino acid kinase family protein [Cysteiniphilum sp. 6C5]|uniref:amino acid kinase family protein n=1 Tax=unclassified Cysteiniphilum TaxID=2610889 RepID=UPI003F839B37